MCLVIENDNHKINNNNNNIMNNGKPPHNIYIIHVILNKNTMVVIKTIHNALLFIM